MEDQAFRTMRFNKMIVKEDSLRLSLEVNSHQLLEDQSPYLIKRKEFFIDLDTEQRMQLDGQIGVLSQD